MSETHTYTDGYIIADSFEYPSQIIRLGEDINRRLPEGSSLVRIEMKFNGRPHRAVIQTEYCRIYFDIFKDADGYYAAISGDTIEGEEL